MVNMGIRKTNAEKLARGNPGKRKLAPETGVQVADLRCPKGLPKEQKKYWHLYAPNLVRMGKLTVINLPDFLKMIRLEARLDYIDDALERGFTDPGSEGSASILQEKKNYHGEVVDIGESLYSKLSRAYHETIRRYKADFGIRADKMGGLYKPEPKPTEEEEFLGDQ